MALRHPLFRNKKELRTRKGREDWGQEEWPKWERKAVQILNLSGVCTWGHAIEAKLLWWPCWGPVTEVKLSGGQGKGWSQANCLRVEWQLDHRLETRGWRRPDCRHGSQHQASSRPMTGCRTDRQQGVSTRHQADQWQGVRTRCRTDLRLGTRNRAGLTTRHGWQTTNTKH